MADEFLVAYGPLWYRVTDGKVRPEGDRPTLAQHSYLPRIAAVLPLLRFMDYETLKGSTANRLYRLPGPGDEQGMVSNFYDALTRARSGGQMSKDEYDRFRDQYQAFGFLPK